jgi:hypothetical protein
MAGYNDESRCVFRIVLTLGTVVTLMGKATYVMAATIIAGEADNYAGEDAARFRKEVADGALGQLFHLAPNEQWSGEFKSDTRRSLSWCVTREP